MKRQEKADRKNSSNRKSYEAWKKRRDIVIRSIPLEVDLENREIFFQPELKQKLDFEFDTNNIDSLIHAFVAPEDSPKLMRSLSEAQQGMEKPITFKFIHPITAQRLKFEYRYEIIYVRYSSTRLHGVLVNLREPRPKKQPGSQNRPGRPR